MSMNTFDKTLEIFRKLMFMNSTPGQFAVLGEELFTWKLSHIFSCCYIRW
jgi:hypothetical protein